MSLNEVDKKDLDLIAESLPKYPPLKPGGDVSIKELYPDLTEEELDYVWSKYKGEMRLR